MRFVLYLAFGLAMTTAFATEQPKKHREITAGTAIIYSRDKVFIEVHAPLPESSSTSEKPKIDKPSYGRTGDGSILNAKKDTKEEEVIRPENSTSDIHTELRRYYFDTDVKPQESLELNWFYSLASIQDGRAAMIVMKDAAPMELPDAKIYKPVDVLVIGDDGTILAILPEIILGKQDKRIKLDMPVKALMYVSSGATASLHIVPKDSVKYRIFTANPTVLQ